MADFTNGHTQGSEGPSGESSDYLNRAVEACRTGDFKLGMHLYLAAFEQAAAHGVPTEDVLNGLHEAWQLACQSKERALAEYIFEKMSPYLSENEMAECAMSLQTLAFDRLEEFGVSSEDLRDMAELFSSGMMDFTMIGGEASPFCAMGFGGFGVDADEDDDSIVDSDGEDCGEAVAEAGAASPMQGAPDFSELADFLRLPTMTPDSQEAAGSLANMAAFGAAENLQGQESGSEQSVEGRKRRASREESPATFLAKAAAELERSNVEQVEELNYDMLAGYKGAIRAMRDLGIGMKDDATFKELVSSLNERHGLDRMPSTDAILLCSPAREDASRFMQATVGELRQPVVHMNMEENFAGMPILCVTAASMGEKRLSALRNAFVNGGVLVLEDIDLWAPPAMEPSPEPANFLISSMSRGAKDALNLVQAAVDNPQIMVLATAADVEAIDPFFLEMLEPITLVDIAYPTEEERREIWIEIARDHPSIRHIPLSELVRLTASMARYDMYMAVREAIEDAYKNGLMNRSYVPVSRENLYEKLAAYQPLDSQEYRELEQTVLEDFRNDLANIDDLLK